MFNILPYEWRGPSRPSDKLSSINCITKSLDWQTACSTMEEQSQFLCVHFAVGAGCVGTGTHQSVLSALWSSMMCSSLWWMVMSEFLVMVTLMLVKTAVQLPSHACPAKKSGVYIDQMEQHMVTAVALEGRLCHFQ